MRIAELCSVAGKVVVVTGGSRGIGRMIAEAFVVNGARVTITARKADACHATAEELSQHGLCTSLPADLSTADGRRNFVEQLTSLSRVEEDTDRDFFMSPAEAMEYGLIDKVIEKRPIRAV